MKGGGSTSYTYDTLDRLETVTYPIDTTYPAGRVAAYAYDKVGNRTRETVTVPGGAVLVDQQGDFDDLNRLTALTNLLLPAGDPERVTAFTWDPNGNQLTKQAGTATPTEYRYDLRDRLVEVGQGAFIPARFQYDFEGRRTKKIGQDGLRQYVYDQTSVLVEYDEDGDALAKYEYGSDRLLSMDRVTEGRRWYSLDGLRSVVGLTDDAGASVASYHLDAWGNFRFPSELLASANRHAFTGYQWDQETSLFFAKARFYGPQVGRFTTQDSYLGDRSDPPSLHRYTYAHVRPTYFVDPSGHTAEGAQLQAVLSEAREHVLSGATGNGFFNKVKAVGLAVVAAGLGLTAQVVGAVDTAATVSYAVPGLHMAGDPTGLQARDELKEQLAQVKETYLVVQEEGFGNALGRVAKAASDTVGAAARGDTQALARVVATLTELGAPVAGLAKSGVSAAQALGKTGREIAGEVAKGARRGLDDVGRAADDLAVRPRVAGGSQGADVLDSAVLNAPHGGPPPRPSWQAAQAGPADDLAGFGFEAEPSYLGGKRVPYGTKGSVRPDYASERVRLSADVKNYDVTTPQGRWRLVKDVVGQTGDRATNLPQGMRQGVVIDIRGQQISDKLLQRMLGRIVKKSNGVIQPENIEVVR